MVIKNPLLLLIHTMMFQNRNHVCLSFFYCLQLSLLQTYKVYLKIKLYYKTLYFPLPTNSKYPLSRKNCNCCRILSFIWLFSGYFSERIGSKLYISWRLNSFVGIISIHFMISRIHPFDSVDFFSRKNSVLFQFCNISFLSCCSPLRI